MKKSLVAFWGVIAAALLSACGGGGSSVTPTGPTTSKSTAIEFSITVPPASSAVGIQRRPQFIAAAGTQSVTISLTSVDGKASAGTTITQNLSASTSGCSSSSGQLTCTASMQVPPGSDTFTVVMYPQPGAKGSPLGSGVLTASAVAGQTTSAPATLSGIVAAIQLSAGPAVVPEGMATSVPLTVIAKDVAGNTIVGPYAYPITLADTDASQSTSVSATSIADSTAAAAVTINYNGGAMTQPASIAASAQNAKPANVTFAPNASYPAVNQATLTYGTAEQGIGGGNFETSPPLFSEPPFTGTMTVTVSTNASFNGQQGLTDFHVQTSPSPLPAVTTDEYYTWKAGANTASLLYVGSTSWTPSQMSGAASTDGTKDTVACQAPYAATWVMPFPQSRDALTGTGPCVEHRTVQNTYYGSVDVSIYDRTLNADGSYLSQSGYTLNGGPENMGDIRTVNADGTGVENVLWATSGPGGLTTYSALIVMGTPAPGASTIPYLITKFTGPVPSPGSTATPAPTATTMPNWYAQVGVPGGVASSPLATTTFTNKGTVAGLPAQCAVPLSIVSATTPITEVDETHRALDPLESYEVDTSQYFIVDGIGTVCIQQTSMVNGFSNLYLAPPFSSGGSYETYTAYLTASTLKSAMTASHNVRTATAYAQSGLFALVRLHNEMIRRNKGMRR